MTDREDQKEAPPKRMKQANEQGTCSQAPIHNLDIFLAELLEIKVESIENTLSEIMFQGFRPREFLAVLQRRADEQKVFRASHKKNFVTLGLICALRGSKISKIIASTGTTKRLKDLLTDLRSKYQLEEGRPTGPLSPTLPRILAVTALPGSAIIHNDGGENVSLPLCPDEVAPNYPFVFCMSHAGALLPVSVEDYALMSRAVAYGQYLMTVKFGGKAIKSQVLQFVSVAPRSNLWTDEQKVAHLNKLGIMERYKVADDCLQALEEAAHKFDRLP